MAFTRPRKPHDTLRFRNDCLWEFLSMHPLITRLRSLAQEERSLAEQIIRTLHEIEDGEVHLIHGYSSLFTLLTGGCHYSESHAARMVGAARTLKRYPMLFEKLRDGSLHLTALSLLTPLLTEENVELLAKKASGLSKRALEVLIAEYRSPVAIIPRETVKPRHVVVAMAAAAATPTGGSNGGGYDHSLPIPAVASESPQRPPTPNEQKSSVVYTVSMTFTAEEYELLQSVQKQVGGKQMRDVVVSLASKEERLKRVRQKRGEERNTQQFGEVSQKNTAAPEKINSKQSRFIPISVRRTVQARDGYQCTYRSPDGIRCSCTTALQLDHCEPYAMGGAHTTENLRLLCSAHNQYMARQAFGKEKILRYTRRE